MIGGHMITVISGKRPRTYLIGETDPAKAARLLAERLGGSPGLEPFPVPLEVARDHGIAAGEVKLLHL